MTESVRSYSAATAARRSRTGSGRRTRRPRAGPTVARRRSIRSGASPTAPEQLVRACRAAGAPDPATAIASGRRCAIDPSTGRIGEEVVAWLKTLASAAVYATLIVTFGFQVARVEGQSMAPTLADQDRLIVNKAAYRFFEDRRSATS